MKKILLILLSFFILQTNVFAEKLPEYKIGEPDFSKVNNPIFYKYISDYQKQLYDAFDENKFKNQEWGYGFTYTINKDGSITNVRQDSDLYDYEKYIREIVLKNPPPPLPKEVEIDSINIDFDFFSVDYKDSNTISYRTLNKEMDISITKQRLTKNPIKKFLYYHGILLD